MPTDRTHDSACVKFHIKDLEEFGHCLEQAANAAFPRGLSRYKKVHVLLLSWEGDNLGVITEISELHIVFQQIYLYNVEIWSIPSDQPFKALRKQINTFLNNFEDKDNLLIVYYGGHGFMNDDRQCIWSCTGEPESSTVQWSGLQTMFEYAESDVLILLDCCAAASSISATGSGVTEVIAACGFETGAPGVGEHSFTRTLIDELKYWSRVHTLSVAMLHNKVLSRIKYWRPRFGTTGEHEHRKTPIYIVLSNEGQTRSIRLVPLQFNGHSAARHAISSTQGSPSVSSKSSTEAQSITDGHLLDSSQSSIDKVWPDREFHHPKVLISLSLEEDQILNTDEWVEWMRSVPAFVKYANVDGIYKSGSTLMLLTVPVAIWDLLPKNPAIAFIGFTNSWNLLSNSLPPLVGSHESTKVERRVPFLKSGDRHTTDEMKSNLKSSVTWGRLKSSSFLDQMDRDEARVDFKKTVYGYNGRAGYRNIRVLFLTWKDDNLQCRETEVDKLRDLFSEGFKFKTVQFEIPSERWETALYRATTDFCYGYDSPEELAIVYYGSNTYTYVGQETTEFKLAAEFNKPIDLQTFFGDIRTCLRPCRADLLMLLDCPHSATAFPRDTFDKEKVELMASAAHNVTSPGPNEPDSFTRSLKEALSRVLKQSPNGISTYDLYREVYHTVPIDNPYKPRLFSLSSHDAGSIWICHQLTYLQAEKLRPLIRKIHARRQLRRLMDLRSKGHPAGAPASLLQQSVAQDRPPADDWSSAMQDYYQPVIQKSHDGKERSMNGPPSPGSLPSKRAFNEHEAELPEEYATQDTKLRALKRQRALSDDQDSPPKNEND